MTTPTPRWTAETEATATRALWEHGHLGSPLDEATERDEPAAVAFTRGAVRAVLDSLARVGVLTAVGGETRQEWGVLHETFGVDGPLTAVDGNHEALARRMAAASSLKLVQRTVGPWREVTDDPA